MLIQFLLIALYYGFLAGGPFYVLSNPLREPVVIGFVVGLIFGDPVAGSVAGAYIGLVYLGAITIADQMPSNRMVGAIIGVTFVLTSGLDYGAGLAVAVPLGMVTANLRNWVETIAVAFGSGIPRSVHEHNLKKMWFWTLANGLFKFTFYAVFMFLALQLGLSALANAFELLPDWVLNGLNVGGAVLPGVGLAMGLVAIGGKGKYFLSIASFVVAKMMGLSTLACVLIAVSIVVVMIYHKIDSGELLAEEDGPRPAAQRTEAGRRLLSFGDVFMGIFHTVNISWGEEMSKNNGNNVLLGMYLVLKKLYPGDPEKQCEELEKHDAYMNLFPPFMGLVTGPVIMMEEERALGNEAITAESIQGFKASMQGPAMALGDALGSGVVMVILNTVGISMAQNGNPLGSLFTFAGELLFPFILCYLSAFLCYQYGSTLIGKLYHPSTTKLITEMAGAVGCVAFGALAAFTIPLSTGDLSVFGINLQATLFDAILPGLLPLSLMLVCYGLLAKRKITVVPLITLVFFICFVLGACGILS